MGMQSAIVGSLDMDTAIVASFEESGRRGWLHTAIDRWLWDGRERKPAKSIELIERNLAEFERYGGVPFVSTPFQTAGGIQTVRAALLSFGQSLLYCTLSEAPRAADVREALIRTFTRYTNGELVPVTTDAAIQSASWDRMTEAISGLAATVDRGFQSVGREVGQLREEVSNTNARIDVLADRVGSIEARTRKEPKPGDVALMASIVAAHYGGKCPCCEDVLILDASGAKAEVWTVDHTNGPWDNRHEHLWPVCRTCNQHLWGEVGFRSQVRSEFAVFQKRLVKQRPEQLRLLM
jgi:hypothetical protein